MESCWIPPTNLITTPIRHMSHPLFSAKLMPTDVMVFLRLGWRGLRLQFWCLLHLCSHPFFSSRLDKRNQVISSSGPNDNRIHQQFEVSSDDHTEDEYRHGFEQSADRTAYRIIPESYHELMSHFLLRSYLGIPVRICDAVNILFEGIRKPLF